MIIVANKCTNCKENYKTEDLQQKWSVTMDIMSPNDEEFAKMVSRRNIKMHVVSRGTGGGRSDEVEFTGKHKDMLNLFDDHDTDTGIGNCTDSDSMWIYMNNRIKRSD